VVGKNQEAPQPNTSNPYQQPNPTTIDEFSILVRPMRFRFGFLVVNRLLLIFLVTIALGLTVLGGTLWFFKIDVTARGHGVVKCREWIDIKPEVSGIICQVDVREGQWVQRGDPLFEFEDRERKLEVEAAELKTAELNITIGKSEDSIHLAEQRILGEIDEARARVDAARASYRIAKRGPKPEEIGLAEAGMHRLEIQLEKADSDYLQRKRAYSLQLISKQDFDTAFHLKRLAAADLKVARQELWLLLNKYDGDQIAMARAEMDRCRAVHARALAKKGELDILRKDLEAAVKSLAKEEKRLAVLREHVSLTQVKTPIDGFVLSHDTEHLVGRAVVEGEVVLRIGDSRGYIVDSRVSESDFPLVAVGQPAKVQIKPFPRGEYRLFQGHVTRVGADVHTPRPAGLNLLNVNSGPLGEPGPGHGGLFPVILKLEEPYTIHIYGDRYEVKPGFSAEVEIITRKERILTFLLRRVLRLKGKVLTGSIHL